MTPEEYGILRALEKKNDELEAKIKQMKDDAESWAAGQLIEMESRREYFRTMYCDNCENYRSEKCSTCFSHGFTYPAQYSPGPHMLFRTPHPKDVEIARLRAALEAVSDATISFANAHSLPCLEDAIVIALKSEEAEGKTNEV